MFQMPVATRTPNAGQAIRLNARAASPGHVRAGPAEGRDERGQHELAAHPDGRGEHVQEQAEGLEIDGSTRHGTAPAIRAGRRPAARGSAPGLFSLEHPQAPLVGEHAEQLAVGPLQHLGAAGGATPRRRGRVGAQGQAVRAAAPARSARRTRAPSGARPPRTASARRRRAPAPASPRRSERSTCTTPSGSSCSMPRRNCLCCAVSLPRTTAKCSGANVVSGGY